MLRSHLFAATKFEKLISTGRQFIARAGRKTRGRTKKEILRLLKRAIAREISRLLTRACPIDDYTDLRPARQAKNITLAVVANHFGVPVITVSVMRRGRRSPISL